MKHWLLTELQKNLLLTQRRGKPKLQYLLLFLPYYKVRQTYCLPHVMFTNFHNFCIFVGTSCSENVFFLVSVEETQKSDVFPRQPMSDELPLAQPQQEEIKDTVQTVEDQKVQPEIEETPLEISAEVVETAIDNRMLDPDAMIESLDRFTAELVSQASHLQNKDEVKYTASVTEGSTWNEDTSPNDVTFPSISGSAPNVITFESESANGTSDEVVEDVGVVENEDKGVSNDFSSLNTTSTMTDSTLIAMEATKVMNAMKMEDVAQKKGECKL